MKHMKNKIIKTKYSSSFVYINSKLNRNRNHRARGGNYRKIRKRNKRTAGERKAFGCAHSETKGFSIPIKEEQKEKKEREKKEKNKHKKLKKYNTNYNFSLT